MKKFSELGTAHRGDPCEEYPGVWLLYIPEIVVEKKLSVYRENSCKSLKDAKTLAKGMMDKLEELEVDYNPSDFSICWECSDNDVRQGKVWFTGFYRVGKFDSFGNWMEG